MTFLLTLKHSTMANVRHCGRFIPTVTNCTLFVIITNLIQRNLAMGAELELKPLVRRSRPQEFLGSDSLRFHRGTVDPKLQKEPHNF